MAETIEIKSLLNKDDLIVLINDALKENKGLNISGKFTKPYTFTTYPKTELAQIQTLGVFESSIYLDGIIENCETGCLVKLTLTTNPAYWLILLVLLAFIPIGVFSSQLFTSSMFIGGAIITFVAIRYYLITLRNELLISFKRILLFLYK